MPKARLAELYRSLASAMACPQDTGIRLANLGLYVDCGVLQPVRGGGTLNGLVQNGATLLPAQPPLGVGAARDRNPRKAARAGRRAR
jgi:hypothetical protein